MSTTVFLTNTYIRVVVGSGSKRSAKVKKACECELPEGCLINGLITNEHDLAECIGQMWTENKLPRKEVHVVISSTHFTMKNMKAPVMNRKKTREYIVNEFPEVENGEEMLYDYQTIGHDSASKMDDLLAVMAEKEIIVNLAKLFKTINISVNCIRSSRCSIISMLNSSAFMKGKTCILQLIEGHDLVSLLFVDGRYIYSSKSRLFSIRGTEDIGTEVARSVSGILQFVMTQKIESRVTNVYLAGLQPEEMRYSRHSIDLLEMELQVEELENKAVKMPTDVRYSDYLSPVSDLMGDDKGMNFLEVSQEKKKDKEKSKELWRTIRPILILFGVMASVSAVLLILNMRRQKDLDALMAYNMDETNLTSYQEALVLQKQVSSMTATLQEVEGFSKIKDSYPWATSAIIKAVEKASEGYATVTVTSYQADSGTLVMTASAADVTAINKYIDRLEETGVFESVDYSGYNLSEKDGQQQYNINVSCHLAEDAGK